MTARDLLFNTYLQAKDEPNRDVQEIAEEIIDREGATDEELDKFWVTLYYGNFIYTNPCSGTSEFYSDVNINKIIETAQALEGQDLKGLL